jgi:hypothetical protein
MYSLKREDIKYYYHKHNQKLLIFVYGNQNIVLQNTNKSIPEYIRFSINLQNQDKNPNNIGPILINLILVIK